jgi:hypothetical protein
MVICTFNLRESYLTSYSGSCGLFYQRIEEVVEPVLEPKRVLEPFRDEIVESAPARMKYKPNRKVVEDSVSDFRRVRLLYQICYEHRLPWHLALAFVPSGPASSSFLLYPRLMTPL